MRVGETWVQIEGVRNNDSYVKILRVFADRWEMDWVEIQYIETGNTYILARLDFLSRYEKVHEEG